MEGKICIKLNNTATKEPCAICERMAELKIPVALFFEGTYQTVCDDCGFKYVPELAQLVQFAYRRYVVEDEPPL
ncbi:MAG TPA: hypothetical protein VHT73_14855 [Thermodesulfobacteriota bacterium]|nr:hypothetical protein [Thermodesulfobacteriota bacterium]